MVKASVPWLLSWWAGWLFVASSASSEPSVEVELVARSTLCINSTTFTAENGLEFHQLCGYDAPGNSLSSQAYIAADLDKCCELCARSRPPCYGVAYSWLESACWFKNASITATLETSPDRDVAVVPLSYFQVSDVSCGYQNQSVVPAADANFTVYCSMDMLGYDFYPNGTDYIHHAASFAECMQLCVSTHPFCVGVAYNPGLLLGYGNCYVKFTAGLAYLTPPPTGSVVHSAVLNIPTLQDSCENNGNYTAGAQALVFDQFCGRATSGANVSLHTDTFQDCMDGCAENVAADCVAVVWDELMTSGYDNCYMLSSTGQVTSVESMNYATIIDHAAVAAPTSNSPASTTTTSSSSATSTTSSSASSSSLAWIAGPVIGGVAAIGLVSVLLWWRRTRRRRSAPPAYTAAWQDEPPKDDMAAYAGRGELPTDRTVVELAVPPTELAAGRYYPELPP